MESHHCLPTVSCLGAILILCYKVEPVKPFRQIDDVETLSWADMMPANKVLILFGKSYRGGLFCCWAGWGNLLVTQNRTKSDRLALRPQRSTFSHAAIDGLLILARLDSYRGP